MAIIVHDEQLNSRKIKFINFISFLMGFSQAVLAYIISSYFSSAIGSENISVYYLVAYTIILIVLLNFHKVIKRFGKSNVFFATLGAKLISLLFLVLIPPGTAGIIFLISYLIFANLDLVSLDVILESYSVDKKSGRIRGLHLTILDAGFMLGPLVSTRMLDAFNFQTVFLVSLAIETIVIYLTLKKLRGVNHKFNHDLTIYDVISKVINRKNVLRIYYISFLLELFYAIMIIFTPLYLRGLGFSWEQIGIIFTIMLVPFVVFPYPAGYLADKKMGEKELLVFSILVMALSTFIIVFVKTADILLWSIILFLTRVGASLIQTLRDSYFYKRIDGHDVDLINFFRTASPVAYIFASIFSFIVLFYYPMKYIFIFLSIILLTGAYIASKLVDNRCEDEIKSAKAQSS